MFYMQISLIVLVMLATFSLTKVALFYSLNKGLIDHPGKRSSHQNSTPRGGGISVVIVFLLFLLLKLLNDVQSAISMHLYSILLGGFVVAVLGFWDDHRHIAARWRLLVQLFAAFISLTLLSRLPTLTFFSMGIDLGSLALPVYAMALVWSLNLYNFMDGIDGIASVQAITVSTGAAFIYTLNGGIELAYVLFVLAASVCGFLLWNWPPARIFMGDACSSFLGFVLALIAIITSLDDAINLWSWLILSAIFVVDSTYTLIIRVLNGKKFYEAHRSHAYQILSRRFQSHKYITLGVLIVNIIWLIPLAYLASVYEYWAPIISLIALFPLVVIAHMTKAGTLND